jgi:Domain of unknown function (DUF4124)
MPLFQQFSHCLACALLLGLAAPAHAALFKCQLAGKTVYQDAPCPGVKDSKPYTPKNPINTVSSESLTGQSKTAPDHRPSWAKPMDPIADCKAKGGQVDRELKACIVP